MDKNCGSCFYADKGTCSRCADAPKGATTEISTPFTCANWKHHLSKVLFLDIDGVINSLRTAMAYNGYPFHVDEEHMRKFDHVAIDLIRSICEKTGCRIILSSTWRHYEGHVKIAAAMNLPIVDSTPEKLSATRGEEIAMWLRDHPEVERYVIVDDSTDMLSTQQKHFVKTSGEDGLSYRNYMKILKRLR